MTVAFKHKKPRLGKPGFMETGTGKNNERNTGLTNK